MTAKEALRAIIDDLTEAEALEVFPLLSGRHWDSPSGGPQALSAEELLRLPATLRSLIVRHRLSRLSDDEVRAQAAEAESWAASDSDSLKLIDG